MTTELAVIGSFVQDLAFRVDEFPSPGQTIIGGFFSGPGGKGSNQAVAAHRQEVPTVFIGCVGSDIFASGYQTWCEQESLPTSLLISRQSPTGAASIVINERAENAIVVALGANDDLTPEHVLATLRKESHLKVILLQAESNLKAAEAAMAYGKERGLPSIFNPAPINPLVSARLLEIADCITPNETECAFLISQLTGTPFTEDVTKLSDDSLREVCAHLPTSTVLITVGAAGTILYQKGAPNPQFKGVRQGDIIRTPAIPVAPVDTTGAGDAFNGGLAAGLVKFNGDLPRALRYGTVVAGLSTEKLGTAPAMPTAAEVKNFEQFYL